MKEDLLHFVWGQKKLHGRQLTSTTKEALFIKAPGILNKHAGPDFFNAQIEIAGQLWAGNVEIHLKSSDWYAHNHETDARYDSVILHVVWEDDILVFRKDGTAIPTLELKDHISSTLLKKYQELLDNKKANFINCEVDFGTVDSFLVEQWYHRLFVERLENKSIAIQKCLESSKNDWEAVLFALLAKNFGSKVNGELFMRSAEQLDFSVVRKTRHNLLELESLLFGHFGLLDEEHCTDSYYKELCNAYRYLSKKFKLPKAFQRPRFYGLRPHGFPTIRISQLANLYFCTDSLFSLLMETNNFADLNVVFKVTASPYWENHYTFGKVSKRSFKKTSKSFVDLLIINTVIPLRFCYDRHVGRETTDQLLGWVQELKAEKNTIGDGFERLGNGANNALESQAQLQLYNNYCSKNKCLQCVLGAHLLNRNI